MNKLLRTSESCGRIEQELTFEVSKGDTVVAKVSYNKDYVTKILFSELEKLKREVQDLKTRRVFTTEGSLAELWDNEYDEQWDKC
jgi:hypothetical protein